MSEQVHITLWIRWVLDTWENDGSWATSIQENTLHKKSINEAQFIFPDARCMFVPMSELRRVLSGKSANGKGTIVFRVNPEKSTINKMTANVDLIVSRTHTRSGHKIVLDLD